MCLTHDPCEIRPLASRFRTDRLLSTQRAMRYNKIIVFVGAYGALVIMTLLSCALGFVVNLIPSYITHYLGRFSIRCYLLSDNHLSDNHLSLKSQSEDERRA